MNTRNSEISPKKKNVYSFKRNNNFKPYKNKDLYKQKYGSLQEGHGQAYLQKHKLRKLYYSEKSKENKKLLAKKGSEHISIPTEEDPYAKYNEDREVFEALPSKKQKISKFKQAKQEFANKREEKERKKAERELKLKEAEQKRKANKEKRLIRNKKYSQKTRRGQPLMRARMEMLLENVEQLIDKEKNQ